MSVAAVRAVLKYSEARLSARLVLVVLADSAHDDGISWAGQKVIAAKAKISRAEVDRSVKELEEMGEIEKRKAQRSRRRINVYRINLPGIDEPVYDELPFSLTEPFTVSQLETPSKIDGVSSDASTVSHLAQNAEVGTSLSGLNRNSEPSGSNEPELPACPAMTKVGGRNVGLDALCEECSIKPSDKPMIRLAAALFAGRKEQGEKQAGIRDMFWVEAYEWARDNDDLDRLNALAPDDLEETIARAVRRKAELYRRRFPGLPVTPKALLEWWIRLSTRPAGSTDRLTPEDVMRQAAAEAE